MVMLYEKFCSLVDVKMYQICIIKSILTAVLGPWDETLKKNTLK